MNVNSNNSGSLIRRGRSRDPTRAPRDGAPALPEPPLPFDNVAPSVTMATANVVLQTQPPATCPDAALRPDVAVAFQRTEEALAGGREACGAQARAAEEACAARDQSMKDILGPFLDGLQAEMRQGLQALNGRIAALESVPGVGGAGAGGAGGGGAGGDGAGPPTYPPTPRFSTQPWSAGAELVTAMPMLALPMDMGSWMCRIGTPALTAMASAYVAEQEQRVTSHSLRLAATAALNSFLMTHNHCVEAGMSRSQIGSVVEPSLRVFVALAKTLQVYLAPRQRHLHEAFLPQAFAALVALPEMTPSAVDASIRTTIEQVGSAPDSFRSGGQTRAAREPAQAPRPAAGQGSGPKAKGGSR